MYNLSDEETTTSVEIKDIKISELKPFENKFRLSFKVIEKEEEREVKNKNNPSEVHRISNVTVADDSATIILTAWDSDIDTLDEDKFYTLENGFCNLFNDSMRLVRGKFGEFVETEDEFEPNLSLNRSEEKHQKRQRDGGYQNRSNNSSFRGSNVNYGNFSSNDYGRKPRRF